ncbi:integrase core domain-containing protein [Sulfitobacter litoralis]|nr:transposase [Sulfitobacter litoralis]
MWGLHDAVFAKNAQAPIQGDRTVTVMGRTRKPMQKGFVESFNGKMRDECLDEHLFDSRHHARRLIAAWRNDFNHHRQHTSLAGLTPAEYANRSKEDQYLNRAS